MVVSWFVWLVCSLVNWFVLFFLDCWFIWLVGLLVHLVGSFGWLVALVGSFG